MKTTTVWRAVATGGGGRCEEDHHRLASGGYGSVATGAVDDSYVATRCQAVEVARKTTTVWRAVATGGGGRGEEDYHRLASGGYGRRWMLRGRPPPSGERWLRVEVATGGR